MTHDCKNPTTPCDHPSHDSGEAVERLAKHLCAKKWAHIQKHDEDGFQLQMSQWEAFKPEALEYLQAAMGEQ